MPATEPAATSHHPPATPRPAVSVVMPFAGDEESAQRALEALASIERRAGDELIVADNSQGVLARLAARRPDVVLVPAPDQQSSYYARNVGAAEVSNDWILFLDSDCMPRPDILDRYFDAPVGERDGAIAGEILAEDLTDGVVARYQADRGYLSQRRNVTDSPRPYAVTANLLVRTAAWKSIGGFLEGIRSGGDTEFSWRLQDAGWGLAYNGTASVTHRHRESTRSFARVILRYAAGRAWLNRRYPGALPQAAPARMVPRALIAALRWTAARDADRARFRLIDALVIILDRLGPAFPNASAAPADKPRTQASVVVFCDTFPELSETFITAELSAIARAGQPVRVETTRRAARQDLQAVRAHHVDYSEDDPLLRKLRALIWLVARRPGPCLRDLQARRRWRQQEPVAPLRVIAPIARRVEREGAVHLHAHFAAGAALTAMRISQLSGRPYSVTAHAYEIFREPRNLREKLERAAFVTTGCTYNVEYLTRVAPAARVHEVVMGVDGARFARRQPYPGGRSLIAIGRLVEKKGFAYLIDAVAQLERGDPIERLDLIGDGSLRGALEQQIAALGIGHRVRLHGAISHDAVRELLEHADLLAMPCVVAGDGDRDSMPVVVKEALALEVPVVASDEVGLPELVTSAWGRLVPPAEPAALARAIADLLLLEPQQRIWMGQAGRQHVLARCNVDAETAKLLGLIAEVT